jgi:hypothetical protein
MHQQRIPQRPSQEGRTHIPEVEMEKNPMQKKLRIIVLKHLAEKPRAGYGLIKRYRRVHWVEAKLRLHLPLARKPQNRGSH